MSTAVLGLRLFLAAVFVVSAVAKITQRPSLHASLAGFGLPTWLTRLAVPLLPMVELAVAVALVPGVSARAGAVAVVMLLAVFTGVILWNLRGGRRPACNCFGSLSKEPISGRSVARNLFLLAAAATIAASRDQSALADYQVAHVALGGVAALALGVLAAQAWMMSRLLRQHGALLLRLDALERSGISAPDANEQGLGLQVGSEAPEFALSGMHGETMTLGALRAVGRPVLLVFSDPGCGPCTTLMPVLAQWQRDHADKLRVVVVASGTLDANRAKAAEHGVADVLVQQRSEVADLYQYQGTPGAVLIDVGGRIASPLATGAPAIESLVNRVTGTVPVVLGRHGHHDHRHAHGPAETGAAVTGLPIGDEAPTITLPTVGGGQASLTEFRGRDVIVLFWNPRCGFCEQMLPELHTWERNRTPDTPELFVVSTGDEAANAGTGLTSTIALDATSSAMAAFGATGTPMAVRIDPEGKVASSLAVGAPGIRPLLAQQVEVVAP